jgi:uncharacterized Tic20 family protein
MPQVIEDPVYGKVTDEQKNMAQMCHFSALAGVILAGSVNWLGPVIIWSSKKNLGPFVDAHGKEALNFQLTYLLPQLILLILAITLSFGDWLWVLIFALNVYLGVMAIMAGMKVGQGEFYRYPATIRLIR